jgi:pimeloyl-ACP methyl ester carboxylesterase
MNERSGEARMVPVGEGIRLAYDDVGSGEPPLLLLHGMASNRHDMARQAEYLGGSHRVVSLDMRGHGDSDAPAGRYDAATLLSDFAAAIRALELERPVVIGHSWGASMALALGARSPGLVRAVVALDPSLRPPSARRADLEDYYAGLGGSDHAERVLDYVRAHLAEPSDPPGLVEPALVTMSLTRPHAYLAMARAALEFDTVVAARECAVPALLVLPTRPRLTDVGLLPSFSPTLQVAQVVGSGHFMQLVVADQVNAMIRRFLELLDVAPSPVA